MVIGDTTTPYRDSYHRCFPVALSSLLVPRDWWSLQDFDALKRRCDVYDNAVAAIYLTKRGHMDAAKQILDTFLRLMYPTDFTNIYPEELHPGCTRCSTS